MRNVLNVNWQIYFALALLSRIRGEDDDCSLLGQRYKVGDVFYPKLESSRSNYCVTCKCSSDSIGHPGLNCTSTTCSAACTASTDSACCSICSDKDPGSQKTIDHQSDAAFGSFGMMIPIARMGTSGYLGDPNPSPRIDNSFTGRCVVGSVSYPHGSTYQGNSTDSKGDKCSQCSCNNGKSVCKNKTCPRIACPNPVKTPSNCCFSCPEDLEEEPKWQSEVSFSNGGANGGVNADCKSGDRYYSNGASWHPIIGPFGEMDCVLCRCTSGRIHCSRLKCQSKQELQCDKPVKTTGHCCPVCESNKYEDGVKNSFGKGEPTKRCVSTRSDFTVWKSSGGGVASQVLQYLFVPFGGSKNGDSEIQHHRMMLRNRRIEDVSAQRITVADHSRLKAKFHFDIIGGTTRRLLAKLERKENQLMEACAPSYSPASPSPASQNPRHLLSQSHGSGCTLSPSHFEQILKLRKIGSKQWCGAGETEI